MRDRNKHFVLTQKRISCNGQRKCANLANPYFQGMGEANYHASHLFGSVTFAKISLYSSEVRGAPQSNALAEAALMKQWTA